MLLLHWRSFSTVFQKSIYLKILTKHKSTVLEFFYFNFSRLKGNSLPFVYLQISIFSQFFSFLCWLDCLVIKLGAVQHCLQVHMNFALWSPLYFILIKTVWLKNLCVPNTYIVHNTYLVSRDKNLEWLISLDPQWEELIYTLLNMGMVSKSQN